MSPKPYAVIRSVHIAADPAAIHPHINDFHHWVAWSPWEDIDPGMKRTYSGADAGAGAVYHWDGDRKAGAGRMSITESNERTIDIDLEFSRPFPAENQIEFGLAPTDGGTTVTWTMHGELTGFMKVFSLIRPMDKLVGPDFERGLAKLKAVVEGSRG